MSLLCEAENVEINGKNIVITDPREEIPPTPTPKPFKPWINTSAGKSLIISTAVLITALGILVVTKRRKQ